MTESRPLHIALPGSGAEVSGLLLQPPDARLLYVLAHGAGAGMRHPFLERGRIFLPLGPGNVLGVVAGR